MSTTYVIGANLPGYLPDSEPYAVTGTFADAQSALVGDLIFEADYAINEDDSDEYADAAADVRSWTGPDTVYVCGRAYWIVRQ